jgi:hypothetical protein
MKRSEKIRLVKGLLLGAIELEELAAPEIEVWIQVIGTDSYCHFKTGAIYTKAAISKREGLNRQIIIMDYISGRTIL